MAIRKTRKYITVGMAVRRWGEGDITAATIRNWCKKGLGFRLGGQWRVDSEKFEKLMMGEQSWRKGRPRKRFKSKDR